MRLHRLRLTAFGSFPGEEEVDFDALGAAGLFLVHGPTGAGKTTVLDAVCYALYGRVPGHRDSARSLRCDHAPAERGPSVELEFTLRGRRLRVTRSPAWQRPKLRGEGLIEEKPKVIVAELTGGDWVARTRRLDEAGHLLGGLLGMSADQFWQVAMLPQGDFAKFLRATGDERGKLLKHLFSVQVFTDAESWLADHRTRTGRERQELAHAVDVVVKRMEEAAGDRVLSGLSLAKEAVDPHVPSGPSPAKAEPEVVSSGTASPGSSGTGTSRSEPTSSEVPDESPAAGTPRSGTSEDELSQGELFAAAALGPETSDGADGDSPRQATTGSGARAAENSRSTRVRPAADPSVDPLDWADGLVARAAALLAEATVDCAVRETAALGARERLDGARALADRRRRHAEALARQALLEETADERSELGTVLDEAARADRVLPLAQAVIQRAESAAKAARLAADALARIPFADAAASDAAASDAAVPGRSGSAAFGAPDAAVPGRSLSAVLGASGRTVPGATGADDDGGPVRSAYEPEWLSARERERRDEIARLGELRAEEGRLGESRDERERIERELIAWAAREEEITARLDVLPETRRGNDEELRVARLAAARLPAAETAYARAVELRQAAAVVDQAHAVLPPGVGELERAARDRLDEIARLEALHDDEIRLGEVESRLAELEAEAVALAPQEESARTALAGLPERLAAVNEALAEARSDAARVPAGQAVVDAAHARLDAARRRDALEAELNAAEQERRDATDRAQELRDRLQEIRQARIEGMAAELALHLTPGGPCAVCGSTEHPDPASATSAAATADDEAEAQARYDEADQARQDAEHRCAVLTGQLDQAAALAEDLTVTEAGDALDLAEAELAALLATARREPELAAHAEELQRELDAAEARLREIERLLAEQRTFGAGLAAERDRLATRLRAAQGEDTSVTARKDRLATEAAAIRSATEAAARAEQAAAAYATARATVDDDLADALDQALPPARDRARHRAFGASEADGQGLLQSRTDDRAPLQGRTDDGAHDQTGADNRSYHLAAHPAQAHDQAHDRARHRAFGASEADGQGLLQSRPDEGAHDQTGADNRSYHLAVHPAQAHDQAFARALGVLERLRGAAARETELVGVAERLEAEAARLGGEAAELARRLAVGRARRDELDADIGRIGEVLERARGEDATLAARLDRLLDEAELLREAAEAAGLARTADTELVAARARAEAAAAEAGFARLADAEAAVRTAEEREAMAERLRALDAEQAAVTLLLADPELVAAAAEPEPDLTALESAHREAADAHQASASARDEADRRHERLLALRRELDETCARLRPAEARYDLARRMAELAGGTSADNPLHIRLSSYVLGERLRQVVDAANERLDHMSAGRYLLLYDQRKSAGDRRKSGGGLGLRVLDGWTGVDRDPATLSGGESFICALALALGLADVVTAEAGGVEIGTLFVDEGFGTLDEDTLDGVLDILDGLRSGGRTVGIVSHVAELRTRIQARLRVDKGRTGSTLRVIAAPSA